MYHYIGEAWKRNWKEKPSLMRQRAVEWRRQPVILRLERPSRLDKARMYGYKAKQGFVVARIRVGRGGMRRKRPSSGRRPKHLGVLRLKGKVGMQTVAERRMGRKYPNMSVLNSYLVYKDGKYEWYEVLLVDRAHPAILKDKEITIPRILR